MQKVLTRIANHELMTDWNSLSTEKMAISSSVCWMPTGSFGLPLLTQISGAINAVGTSEDVGAMNVEGRTKQKNVC